MLIGSASCGSGSADAALGDGAGDENDSGPRAQACSGAASEPGSQPTQNDSGPRAQPCSGAASEPGSQPTQESQPTQSDSDDDGACAQGAPAPAPAASADGPQQTKRKRKGRLESAQSKLELAQEKLGKAQRSMAMATDAQKNARNPSTHDIRVSACEQKLKVKNASPADCLRLRSSPLSPLLSSM